MNSNAQERLKHLDTLEGVITHFGSKAESCERCEEKSGIAAEAAYGAALYPVARAIQTLARELQQLKQQINPK